MDLSGVKKPIQASFDHFTAEIQKIRGSRANPHLLVDLKANVYGSAMPIKQLGTVNVVDPTLITVHCWDKASAEPIKKAIEESDLGVTPSIDGNLIRVPLPPLTEERREELVKVVKKIAEEAKISIRRARRDFLDGLKAKNATEDDLERGEKEVQRLVDEFNEKIENEATEKEKELLTV